MELTIISNLFAQIAIQIVKNVRPPDQLLALIVMETETIFLNAYALMVFTMTVVTAPVLPVIQYV